MRRSSLWLANLLVVLGAGTPSAGAVLAADRAARPTSAHVAYFLLTSAGVLLIGLGLNARALLATPVLRSRLHVFVLTIGTVVLVMQVAILMLFFRPYLWSR